MKLKLSPTTKQVFMVIVMIMWVTSFFMDLVNPKYDPPDYMNPLILLVGGYLFATASKDKESK